MQRAWSPPAQTLTDRRTPLVIVLAALLVAAAVVTGERAASVGYPWLDAAPPPAPDILYWPRYFPAGSRPAALGISGLGGRAVELEIRVVLATGDELRVWQTTRPGAVPADAAGTFVEDTVLVGTVAMWRLGHTPDGRSNLLYARVGPTLVVIVGPVTADELLRIADSLRRTRASSLIL